MFWKIKRKAFSKENQKGAIYSILDIKDRIRKNSADTIIFELRIFFEKF